MGQICMICIKEAHQGEASQDRSFESGREADEAQLRCDELQQSQSPGETRSWAGPLKLSQIKARGSNICTPALTRL